MPKDINVGGYTESTAKDCSCRVFYISFEGLGDSNGAKGEVYGIHHSRDTIVGIIKTTLRANDNDALRTYISRMTYFIKTQSHFPGREIIAARDSKKGIVDGIYYFGYSDDKMKTFRVIGVVGQALIEETYKPRTTYKPKFVN